MAYTQRLSLREVKEAYQRIAPFVHQTPVMTCSTLDKLASQKAGKPVQLVFKCENFQKTGAFKARGACNAVQIAKAQGVPGVVTHSSGNHGQAVAWAASKCVANIPCTVVVPKGTPAIKCEAIKGYGAELVFCESSPTSRKETCDAIAQATGKSIIHPYDNYNVMAGQATIAYELLDLQGFQDVDAILVPISGGGMTSGIAVAAKSINPKIKVIAVEPTGKDLSPSLKAGQRLWPNPPQFLDTIAEGIKTQQVGQLTFPILLDLIEKDVITVSDQDMIAAMRLVAERMKVVIEAAAGASVAAAVFHADKMASKWPHLEKIAVILCGGNVDLDKLPWTQ